MSESGWLLPDKKKIREETGGDDAAVADVTVMRDERFLIKMSRAAFP
jgi:hypothetical protein